MRKIFKGLLFIFLNFNINIGACTIGLIPSFLGYNFIKQGSQELSGICPHFENTAYAAKVMTVLAFIDYVLKLLGLQTDSGFITIVYSFVMTAGLLWVTYLVSGGIFELGLTIGRDLNGENVKRYWMVAAVLNIASAVFSVLAIEILAAAAIIANFVVMIIYISNVNTAKKLYEETYYGGY